jgi:hypothetical protein
MVSSVGGRDRVGRVRSIEATRPEGRALLLVARSRDLTACPSERSIEAAGRHGGTPTGRRVLDPRPVGSATGATDRSGVRIEPCAGVRRPRRVIRSRASSSGGDARHGPARCIVRQVGAGDPATASVAAPKGREVGPRIERGLRQSATAGDAGDGPAGDRCHATRPGRLGIGRVDHRWPLDRVRWVWAARGTRSGQHVHDDRPAANGRHRARRSSVANRMRGAAVRSCDRPTRRGGRPPGTPASLSPWIVPGQGAQIAPNAPCDSSSGPAAK